MSDKADSSHIIALRKQDRLNRLAKERFRIVNGKVEKYAAAPSAPDWKVLRAADEERTIADAEPGQLIGKHGIFIGLWEPKDAEGGSLGKKFRVFAAPEDLGSGSPNMRWHTYNATLERLRNMLYWHGHDGTDFADDRALCEALKKGTYTGGWFIPPYELLSGNDAAENKIQRDNIFAHKDKRDLKETFNNSAGENDDWYWSSTPAQGNAFIKALCMNGFKEDYNKLGFSLKCRPVRLEPVP